MLSYPLNIFTLKTKMNRRKAFKTLTTLGALSFLPCVARSAASLSPSFHFVGLGAAGVNIIRHIKLKGIGGTYTSINWFPNSVQPYEGIHHIPYEYPRELRKCNTQGKQNIPLTGEMKAALSEEEFYVVECGLGGFTGTSLIYPTLSFLKAEGKNYRAICTLPSSSEGRFRNIYAMEKQQELSCFENIRYYHLAANVEKYDELPASKRFTFANKEVFLIFEKEIMTGLLES
jgi:cell division GTPase FtsZ